jgi:hypothetical protein
MPEVAQADEIKIVSTSSEDSQEVRELSGRIWNIGTKLGNGRRFLFDPRGKKYAEMNFHQIDEIKAAGEGKLGLVIEVIPRIKRPLPPESFNFHITKGGFVEKEIGHSSENSEIRKATKEELEDLLMMIGASKPSFGIGERLKLQFSSILPFRRGSR